MNVSTPDKPELRVLLVDDQSDMLAMMNLVMRQRCYQVVTASSAQEALQKVGAFAPHIVVSDIGMPDMDGFEMMEQLRAVHPATSFKSIALSGYSMEDDQERARQAGFDAHFSKPVDFDALFQKMDDFAAAL